MPRSISSTHLDEDSSSEVGTPHLPILTRSQRRRFLKDQKRIIRHIIRTYATDRTVFYTSFDTPGVFDAELEELLGENKVIYEIIFDQTSRTIFSYYRRDIPGEKRYSRRASQLRQRRQRNHIWSGLFLLGQSGHWQGIGVITAQQWTKVKELERAIS